MMTGCRLERLEKQIEETFKVFGRTPLKERLDDILEQAIDLSRYRDVNDIREKLGDLLASSIALCRESDWDTGDVVFAALQKIKEREHQYKSLGRRVNVAFLGGSFNPIHLGHIQAAEAILNASGFIDEVWLIPCNTSLYGKELAPGHHRLKMCEIASKHDGRIKVCDWEIRNNVSGETHHLLKQFLEDKEFADYKFHFAIGMDNAIKCPKWVNWEYVERAVPFIVMPRKGEENAHGKQWFHNPPHVILQDEGRIMEMSSTMVRKAIAFFREHHEVETLEGMNDEVLKYALDHCLY